MERLAAFYERTDGWSRIQLGRFPEVIGAEDARLVAEILLDGIDPPHAIVAAACSASGVDDLVSELTTVRDVSNVTTSDSRGLVARMTGLGIVLLRARTTSREGLATLLRQAWPQSPIVVATPPSAADAVLDAGWLETSLEPPPDLRARHDLVAVTFFHGDHLDLYGAGIGASTIDRIVALASRLGRDVGRATQPF